MPIILQTALISNLFTISQIMYDKFGANTFVRFLGTWKQGRPSGGLVFYLNHPESFTGMFKSLDDGLQGLV